MKRAYGKICPTCGARLDPQEKCDCEEETPNAASQPLMPLPIPECGNLRYVGFFTIPNGPRAGTVLPLYEMTDTTPKKEAPYRK